MKYHQGCGAPEGATACQRWELGIQRGFGVTEREVAKLTDSGGFIMRLEGTDGRSVGIEDDGKVAYAYLLHGERIVGDVWLYNVAETPESVSFRDPEHMPFLNPRAFCRPDAQIPRLGPESNVRCVWTSSHVDLFLDDDWIARLREGARPGWSKLAARSGPLARPLADAS